MNKQNLLRILGLLFLLPGIAVAHTGVGETVGFAHGFIHPIGGADHLLAMVAVGIWAAQIGGRALWVVPSTFVTVLILGGILGFSGIAVPFIEEVILISVLALGILIAVAFRFSIIFSAVVVGFFAIFHGHAHGTEMPLAVGAVSYTIGFALSTAILHVAGMALGIVLQNVKLKNVNRYAGGAIVLCGIYLAVS